METLFVDTHILMWLYAGEMKHLSPKAREALQLSPLLVCPISLLEIDYLFEVGRFKTTSGALISFLQQRHDFEVPNDSFADVVEEAKKLSWTRDPFDRFLAAHASLRKVPILTKDRHIRKHYPRCVW